VIAKHAFAIRCGFELSAIFEEIAVVLKHGMI
jgi:hypothetical protein